MQNWKLTLAYDGTEYRGWQVQPGLRTVQGELQEALGRIVGERPLPQGSGRTDAGVHALGQVASFALASPIPADNLKRALNRILPASVRVLAAGCRSRAQGTAVCGVQRTGPSLSCNPLVWARRWQPFSRASSAPPCLKN